MPLLEYQTPRGVIAYTRRGIGPPVVLLHGLYPGASHHEHHYLERTLQVRHTVYSIDLLGFGQSDIPRISHTAEMHQHMIRDLIREVVDGPIDLVASGMSASIATRLGVYDDELLRRLVLLSPPQKTFYREVPGLADRLTQFVLGRLSVGFTVYETAASRPGLAQFLKENVHDFSKVTPGWLTDLWEQAQEANKMMPYVSALCGYFDMDLAGWLPYVRRPVRVIMGSDLMPVPEKQWFRQAQWSTGKTLTVIDDAKAFPHIEQSATTGKVVEAFLTDD